MAVIVSKMTNPCMRGHCILTKFGTGSYYRKARFCDCMSSFRLSVRPSVTLVDPDHIG